MKKILCALLTILVIVGAAPSIENDIDEQTQNKNEIEAALTEQKHNVNDVELTFTEQTQNVDESKTAFEEQTQNVNEVEAAFEKQMQNISEVEIALAEQMQSMSEVEVAFAEQMQSMSEVEAYFGEETSEFVTGDWDEGLFIHFDDEGYVTLEPNIPAHNLILDGDFLRVRLPMEIAREDITLSLPEGWTYEIDYEEETLPEPNFGSEAKPSPKTYTMVSVQHTWNQHIEEMKQRNIMPLVSPLPIGFSEGTLPANASPQEWNNAIGSGNRVVRVMGNQTNMPNIINISGNRHVIIASNGTNLTHNTLTGTRFTIGAPNNGRHFNLFPGATLTLVQIALNGRTRPSDPVWQGGVSLLGWQPGMGDANPAIIHMLDGSEIHNCRADLGGGIFADMFSEIFINGGTLRENVATSNTHGGGGGARAVWGSKITLRNALIIDNIAIADYGHGGGFDVTNGSEITINEGTVIKGNTAGRRGGGVCIWQNSTGVMNDGQIVENYASESGGGIVLTGVNRLHEPADRSKFTMTGGIIEENWTDDRGGGISGFHPTDAPEQPLMAVQEIIINGGEIRDNTSGNGGGVWFYSGTFHTTGGEIIDNNAVNGAGIYWAEGPGVWRTSGDEIDIRGNKASGNGGGLATVGPHNRTILGRINIQENEAQNGGGVWMGGSGILTMNSGTMPIQGNKATGNGGGVYISTGTFAQSGSSITKNKATGDGGGVYVVGGSSFHGTGGSIIDNIAGDGGGLNVPHSNLRNISIATNFVFDQNFARNGLKINSKLAADWRSTINPEIVTLLGQSIIDEDPARPGFFVEIEPHAFTNYDINAEGLPFWRITYDVGEGEGEGEGEVFAFIDSNNLSVKSDTFLGHGTVLRFDAAPAEQFDRWTVETRKEETTVDGKEVEFNLEEVNRVTPYLYTLTAHTNVLGYFHAQPITTTLTISKEVSGDFGNRNMEFNFIVILRDSLDNAWADGGPLPYIITDSKGDILRDGVLTFNSEGSAVFRLSHGQVIRITDVPLKGSVQIIETVVDKYQAWFIDSEFATDMERTNDTGVRPMTEDREFNFINERNYVPTTGVDLGNIGATLLLTMLMLSFAIIGFVSIRVIKKVQ